ncbi:hypothetical protein [Cyclonatronum proteinivorum]|nr:hypothetical protein [Cyclonatronum proteinivorum]
MNKDIAIEELVEVSLLSLNEDDNTAFFEIVFGSYQNGNNFIKKIEKSRDILFEAYPILGNIETSNRTTFNEGDLQNYFTNLSTGLSDTGGCWALQEDDSGDGPLCGSNWQIVKLAICAAGCSFTGPGVPICGWACWCMLCPENSGLADAIC